MRNNYKDIQTHKKNRFHQNKRPTSSIQIIMQTCNIPCIHQVITKAHLQQSQTIKILNIYQLLGKKYNNKLKNNNNLLKKLLIKSRIMLKYNLIKLMEMLNKIYLNFRLNH